MPVYVAEKVLCHTDCGLVVVNAENLEEAKKLVRAKLGCVYERETMEVVDSLRLMEKNEVVYKYGYDEDYWW
ncbi:MAG: hypothetical protein QXL94_01600 [Candidatus Parvarchaeum sp.]